VFAEKNNPPLKTIGPQMARLLRGLYDRSQTTFTLADAEEITRLRPALASSLLHKAAKRGVVSRLKRGVFILVPPELGSATEYAGNPYLVARGWPAIALLHLPRFGDGDSSHGHSAQLAVFTPARNASRTGRCRAPSFRFVLIPSRHFFGTTRHWVTKQEWVDISDPERTVIDGLRQPEYCGGVTEVAKGLWMRHTDLRRPGWWTMLCA